MKFGDFYIVARAPETLRYRESTSEDSKYTLGALESAGITSSYDVAKCPFFARARVWCPRDRCMRRPSVGAGS